MLTPHPDQFCNKLFYQPSILLGAHSSFLKIIYLSLNDLHLPFPSSIEMTYNFSNVTSFGGCLLFSCNTPTHAILKFNKVVYIFSC